MGWLYHFTSVKSFTVPRRKFITPFSAFLGWLFIYYVTLYFLKLPEEFCLEAILKEKQSAAHILMSDLEIIICYINFSLAFLKSFKSYF